MVAVVSPRPHQVEPDIVYSPSPLIVAILASSDQAVAEYISIRLTKA